MEVFLTPGLRSGRCGVMAEEGLLDALSAGGPDALVDGECLLQVGGSLAGMAVLEVAAAQFFQGSCFLQGRADLAGDGERLVVVVTGLLAGCTAGGELAEAVQHLGLFAPLAEVAVQPQGLLVAGFGGRVVADQLLQRAATLRCCCYVRICQRDSPAAQVQLTGAAQERAAAVIDLLRNGLGRRELGGPVEICLG